MQEAGPVFARALFVVAALALAWASQAGSARAETLIFRISTENNSDHVQTRAIARFADELSRRAGDRLQVSFHFDAELYRDRDLIKALRQGKVEMGVPGTWQMDRSEPSIGIFLLPAFYGRTISNLDRLRDGEMGREVNRRIEDNLGLHVPGRWIDLGFAHVFGIKRNIRGYNDVAGLRVRVAGGEANIKRLETMGAVPRVIAWPDLPQALGENSIDAVLSTNETVASAKLWQLGVTSVFEDQQYFAQYIPLIAGTTWRRLPPDLRTLIEEVWEETVPAARAEAAKAQLAARTELMAHGVTFFRPTAEQAAAQRARLMAIQGGVLAALGADEALAAKAMAVLEEKAP